VIPFTVTAHLLTPPIVDRPILLDGVLLSAVGQRMGAAHPSGWVDDAEVLAVPLPLARVETAHGWWWAASAALPFGPESRGDLNRVPLLEEAGRWTATRTLNQQAGPDKRLRIPYYTRPAMLRLTWTCVGDSAEVGALLRWVPGLGRLTGHGHGWVTRWTVERGGPELAAYGRDLRLRHLPATCPPPPAGLAWAQRQIPLRPPYHARRNAVPCRQVTS